MNAWRGVMAALAVCLAGGAAAAEPKVQGFKAWTLPGYTLFAQNERQAAKLAWHLAVSSEVIPRLLPLERTPDGLPLTVIATRDSSLAGHLPEFQYAGAIVTPARFANYIVFDASLGDEDLRRVAHHIYPDYLLRSQYALEFPPWFSIGLGMFMRDIRLGSKVATIKLIHENDPATGLPTARLLRLDWDEVNILSSKSGAFHWQSMMFVHRALAGEAEFGKQMFGYLTTVNDGTGVDEAVQASFGKTVEELNADLRRYGKRDWFLDARVPFSRPAVPVLGSGRDAGEIEVLEILGRVMAARGRAGRFEGVLDELQSLAPDHPQLQALRLRRAVGTGDQAALEQVLSQVDARATAEPASARAAAVALCEAIDDGDAPASLGERAFEWLLASERALPPDVASAWAFGLLASRLNRETGPALQRLQLAERSQPFNAELARAQALVLERLGRHEEMKVQLANTARYSRFVEQRVWARKKHSEMRISAEAAR